MSTQRNSYFFLNSQGICSPPSYQEVKNFDVSSRPFILIPDNNVCIHTSEINLTQQDKTKKTKAKNFLNYCYTSNITVLPAYGLLERASKPGTLELDKDKLIHFEDTFWRKLWHYSHNDTISSVVATIEPLKTLLYPFYAYLLRIKLILLKREPSCANAERNFQDLYEFTNEIGINLTLPWQFALGIFGGSTEFNKFITPKKAKKGDIFKSLWGAAWDLFYIALIQEHNGIRKKDNNYFPQYILVTDDKLCSTIGDFAKVISAFDYGSRIYNGVMMNANFPHLSHISNLLSEMNLKMFIDMNERCRQRELMPELERQNEINEIINRSKLWILELTKEIQSFHNKGFG